MMTRRNFLRLATSGMAIFVTPRAWAVQLAGDACPPPLSADRAERSIRRYALYLYRRQRRALS